jgi:hypothetical protein
MILQTKNEAATARTAKSCTKTFTLGNDQQSRKSHLAAIRR